MQDTEESPFPRSHSCTESDVRTYLLRVRMKVLSYENRNLKMNPEEVKGPSSPQQQWISEKGKVTECPSLQCPLEIAVLWLKEIENSSQQQSIDGEKMLQFRSRIKKVVRILN